MKILFNSIRKISIKFKKSLFRPKYIIIGKYSWNKTACPGSSQTIDRDLQAVPGAELAKRFKYHAGK